MWNLNKQKENFTRTYTKEVNANENKTLYESKEDEPVLYKNFWRRPHPIHFLASTLENEKLSNRSNTYKLSNRSNTNK